MSNQNKNSAFQMIADVEGDIRDILNINTPDNVPILPVRNLVLFPGVVSPILIGRDSSKIVIQKAEKKGELIGVVCQRDPEVDVPLQEDLYRTGVFAKVMKLLTLPNGNITAIVQCHSRLQLNRITQTSPYLEGDVEALDDQEPEKRDREFKTAMDDLRNLVNEYINVSEDIPDEATFAIKNITNNIMALNFVCSNMPFPVKEKIKLLEMESVKERLFNVMKIIIAEECAELGQAALKLRRTLDPDASPTDVAEDEAEIRFREEVADVLLTLTLVLDGDITIAAKGDITYIMAQKRERWAKRLMNAGRVKDHGCNPDYCELE